MSFDPNAHPYKQTYTQAKLESLLHRIRDISDTVVGLDADDKLKERVRILLENISSYFILMYDDPSGDEE
jgi:hypothetical protein